MKSVHYYGNELNYHTLPEHNDPLITTVPNLVINIDDYLLSIIKELYSDLEKAPEGIKFKYWWIQITACYESPPFIACMFTVQRRKHAHIQQSNAAVHKNESSNINT